MASIINQLEKAGTIKDCLNLDKIKIGAYRVAEARMVESEKYGKKLRFDFEEFFCLFAKTL